MNKQTYERSKQEGIGERMAKAIDGKLTPVPNRVARRRMSKSWKRIVMGKV